MNNIIPWHLRHEQILSKVQNIVFIHDKGKDGLCFIAHPIWLTYDQGDDQETKFTTMLEF